MVQEEFKVIVFHLGEEEYALPVECIKSIEKLQHITRVPNTPPFVKGVVNLRGIVIPIIDLRKRLGIFETKYNENTRIIIISLEDIELGIIVDSANDVANLDKAKIEPQPDIITFKSDQYIEGVIKYNNRLLILLNLKNLIVKDEPKE